MFKELVLAASLAGSAAPAEQQQDPAFITETALPNPVTLLPTEQSRTLAAKRDISPSQNITSVVMTNAETEDARELEELKQTVESFTWKYFDDRERLRGLVNDLAEGYMVLTKSENLDPERLKAQTILSRAHTDFPGKELDLDRLYDAMDEDGLPFITIYDPDDSSGDYHLVNTSIIGNKDSRLDTNAGYKVMEQLWNLWGINDSEGNFPNQGELINVPFENVDPITGESTDLGSSVGFFGGSILLDSGRIMLDGYHRMLDKAINARLIEDKMGIPPSETLQGFDREFVEEIIDISKQAGISSQTLREQYANSPTGQTLIELGRVLTEDSSEYANEGLIWAARIDEKYFRATRE